MKRIILSVFAAAVTAAWAIPAYAGDVTFSGQYRLRGEYTDNNDASDASPDQGDMWTQRVRLTANAKATDDVTAKITIQDTRQWGTLGQLTDTGNTLDLHEAYLNVDDIFGLPVDFRVGRQVLAYGDERLIGGFEWSNNARSFEAFKLMYSNDAVNVDAFTSLITESGAPANDDTSFSGIYATLKQLVPNNTLDVYLLHLTSGNLATGPTVYTVGARLKGAAAGVDYTVELPYQFGETSATSDISAWAFAVKAGYTLPTPMKIRIGAEYDFASGEDTSDPDTEAFNNLFPTNHAHFGIADVVGANQWSNINAWSVNASADINEKLRVYAAYWGFTQDNAAAVTGSSAFTTGASDDLGSEIDIVATYKYNNNVTLEAGVSRFFYGDAAGSDPDDRDWAYFQITGNI